MKAVEHFVPGCLALTLATACAANTPAPRALESSAVNATDQLQKFQQHRRYVVGITPLAGDRQGEVSELIFDQLTKQLGEQLEVRMVEAGALPLDPGARAVTEGNPSVRAALAATQTDVLIWGQVSEQDGKSAPRLFFAAGLDRNGAAAVATANESYQLKDLSLPVWFWMQLGDLLQLVVLTQAAQFDRSCYQVDAASPFIERAEHLVQSKPFKAKSTDIPRTGMWSSSGRWQILLAYARTLLVLGEQSGDSKSLTRAVEVLMMALEDARRERVPLDWASTEAHLGDVLWTMGSRESGTGRLQEAVVAYREALKEWPRERVPLNWAAAQNRLGNALVSLGERELGTGKLEEAVAAFREALKEQTRERVPFAWAATQDNLGNALTSLGERESGTGKLQEGISAYRQALEVRRRERVPLDWARTQNNLGSALTSLGERESDTGSLQEAVAAYREALKEWTRTRVPLNWATAETNLGSVLTKLGERELDQGRLEDAIATFRAALEERTRERVPLDWAVTQNNLGAALARLGKAESGTGRLEEAVAAYREALEERTRERVPLDWALTQSNLGLVLTELSQRRRLPPCDALLAHLNALDVFDSAGHVAARDAERGILTALGDTPSPTPALCPEVSPPQWARIRRLEQSAGQP